MKTHAQQVNEKEAEFSLFNGEFERENKFRLTLYTDSVGNHWFQNEHAAQLFEGWELARAYSRRQAEAGITDQMIAMACNAYHDSAMRSHGEDDSAPIPKAMAEALKAVCPTTHSPQPEIIDAETLQRNINEFLADNQRINHLVLRLRELLGDDRCKSIESVFESMIEICEAVQSTPSQAEAIDQKTPVDEYDYSGEITAKELNDLEQLNIARMARGPQLHSVYLLDKLIRNFRNLRLASIESSDQAEQPMPLLELRDAIAKAIADVVGHGMREKCESHALAVMKIITPELLKTHEYASRGLRRRYAYELDVERAGDRSLANAAKAITGQQRTRAFGMTYIDHLSSAVNWLDGQRNRLHAISCPRPRHMDLPCNCGLDRTIVDVRAVLMDLLELPKDSATLTQLIAELRAREALGRKKYGTDVDRQDLSPAEWLQHFREEMLDGLLYSLRAEGNTDSEASA